MIVAGVVIAAVITPGKAGLVVFGSQLPLDRGEEFLEVPPVLAESPRSYVGDDLELGPGVRARAAGAGRGETDRYVVLEAEDAHLANCSDLTFTGVRYRPSGQTLYCLLGGADELLRLYGIGADSAHGAEVFRI